MHYAHTSQATEPSSVLDSSQMTLPRPHPHNNNDLAAPRAVHLDPSRDAAATDTISRPQTKHPEHRVTTINHDSAHARDDADVNASGDIQVAPSTAPSTGIPDPQPLSLLPRNTTSLSLQTAPPTTSFTNSIEPESHSLPPAVQQESQSASHTVSLSAGTEGYKGTSKPKGSHEDKMPFGIGTRRSSTASENTGKPAPTVSKAARARNLANTNAVTNYEAGLLPRDREAEREAVKKYLAARVRNDWSWPPSDVPSVNAGEKDTQLEGGVVSLKEPTIDIEGQPSKDISNSKQSNVEEQKPPFREERVKTENAAGSSSNVEPLDWKERDDWSYSSDNNHERHLTATEEKPAQAIENETSYGKTPRERRWQRKVDIEKEMSWNEGLRFFTERRDAWTGARSGSLAYKKTPTPPAASATEAAASREKIALSPGNDYESDWEDTQIPIAPPMLPDSRIRAQIAPAAYKTIYDKVVEQGLTPACPINLKDVVGSCIDGWKRDGVWQNKSDPAGNRKRAPTFSSILGLKIEPPKEKPAENISAARKDHASQIGAFKRGFEKVFKKRSSS